MNCSYSKIPSFATPVYRVGSCCDKWDALDGRTSNNATSLLPMIFHQFISILFAPSPLKGEYNCKALPQVLA